MTKYQCIKCGNTYLDGENCSYCYLADSNKKALENLADRIEISQKRHADEMRNSLINVATATAVVGARLKSEGEMTDEDAYKAGYQLENFRYEIFEQIFAFNGFFDFTDIEEKFKPDFFYKNLQRHYLRGAFDYLRNEFGHETALKTGKKSESSAYSLYSHEVWTGFLEDSYNNGYAWNSNFKLFSNITLWGKYYVAGSRMAFEINTAPVILDAKSQIYLLNIGSDSTPFLKHKSQLLSDRINKELWSEYFRGVNNRLSIENKPNIVQERIKVKKQEAMNRTFVYSLTGLIYLLPIFLVAWFYFS